MKNIRFALLILFVFTASACQSQSTPTAMTSNGSANQIATSTPIPTPDKTQPLSTPSEAAPAPASGTNAPAIHTSSSNPNAGNLIAVRDQAIVNHSLIIDSVNAAQAGWLVFYFDKQGQPGELITYIPVTAGKSTQLIVPLDNLKNPVIQINSIPGHKLFALLTEGNPPPGVPVRDNNKMVAVVFNVLAP